MDEGATNERFDVLRYADGDHRVVPRGAGEPVVAAHEDEARRQALVRAIGVLGLSLLLAAVGAVAFPGQFLVVGGLGTLLAGGAAVGTYVWRRDDGVPTVVEAAVPASVVEGYVETFDPDAVSDPFGSAPDT